jgi:hypothetical protein
MTEFIDTNTNANNTMSTYFSKALTTFNEELYLPTNCVPFTDAKFGLLNLQALECGPSDITHELVLVVDNSGSMDDKCPGDNDKSKMDQAIHTLKNIVGFLEENPNIKAYVTIFKFDNNFNKVIERTNVTEDNYKSIEKKINKIRPNGGTYIEKALKETSKYISELKTLYPTHQISHIFMTDGEITCGEERPHLLKDIVVKDIYNYFIGYGSQHDAKLLGVLSDFEKSSYHYIDALEKTGLVFGEILHNITHKVLYDCEIVVEHGVIYNYNTNLYTNKLYIGDIIGESNKVYHLFTDHPTTCYVHLKARTASASTESLEIHVLQETNNDLNFVNYAFRHRTLTLLGEVKKCQDKYDNSSRHIYDVNYLNPEIIRMYKSKMQELFDEMRKYMAGVNDNKEKIFIKMLCDDIHISQKTFGTKYGNMCISSRQTSQGTQRIYTVNTTPYDYDSDSDDDIQKAGGPCFNSDSDSGSDDDIQRTCARPRQRSAGPCFNSYLNDDIQPAPASSNLTIVPDEYEVSNDCMVDSPYLTQTAKTVMRSISYVSSSDSEKSDSDEEEDEMPELLPIDSDDLTISP